MRHSAKGPRNGLTPARPRRWELLERHSSLLILGVFATVSLALGAQAYRQKSAVHDEPIHLTAGYVALAEGDYRVDSSHPPLLRMWAALPLMLDTGIVLNDSGVNTMEPGSWLSEAYLFAHRFLYRDNDADRLLYPARFMMLLLGVALGVLLFLWTRQWLGLTAAAIILVFYRVEPNLAAHAGLVTTDIGLTCFMFGAVYFAWRVSQAFTWPNALATAAFAGLAVVSKFSGVLVIPILAVALLIAGVQQARFEWRRFAAVLGLCVLVSFALIWALYGFRYLPSPSQSWVFAFGATSPAGRGSMLLQGLTWIDRHHLLPNAFTQGVYFAFDSVVRLPGFLAGQYSTDGWWYYFPVAFLIKTPITILVLVLVGVVAARRLLREHSSSVLPFLLVPIVIYMAASMWSGINIGVRHILPIYPFVLLIAAVGVQQLMQWRRPGQAALAGLALGGALEFGTVYPYTLTFFNQLVGGTSNGFRYLADSNLAWGQGLKALKDWMDENAVEHLNLAYFGQADPEYYGIAATHLPGSPRFASDAIGRPQLPGYVAISSTILSGIYLTPAWRVFYSGFQSLDPVAVVGNSIRVYWVDRWPESSVTEADPEEHVELAYALFKAFGWPDHATLHYEQYLATRPDDVAVLVDYGTALGISGRAQEALETLSRAVALAPTDGLAQLTLSHALLGARNVTMAEEHARLAVDLLPDRPDAHLLLGRLLALTNRFPDAEAEWQKVLTLQPGHAEAVTLLNGLQEFLRQRP